MKIHQYVEIIYNIPYIPSVTKDLVQTSKQAVKK